MIFPIGGLKGKTERFFEMQLIAWKVTELILKYISIFKGPFLNMYLLENYDTIKKIEKILTQLSTVAIWKKKVEEVLGGKPELVLFILDIVCHVTLL